MGDTRGVALRAHGATVGSDWAMRGAGPSGDRGPRLVEALGGKGGLVRELSG